MFFRGRAKSAGEGATESPAHRADIQGRTQATRARRKRVLDTEKTGTRSETYMNEHIAAEMILLEAELEIDRLKLQRDRLFKMVMALDFEKLSAEQRRELDRIHKQK
jgi:hypothetical protein